MPYRGYTVRMCAVASAFSLIFAAEIHVVIVRLGEDVNILADQVHLQD